MVNMIEPYKEESTIHVVGLVVCLLHQLNCEEAQEGPLGDISYMARVHCTNMALSKDEPSYPWY